MRKATKALTLAASGALSLMFASPSNAAVSYQYIVDAPNYNVASGSTVTVYVYLKETVTGTGGTTRDRKSVV